MSGLGQHQLDGPPERTGAVHDDGLDPRSGLVIELEQPGKDGSLLAAFGEVEDRSSLGIREHRVELERRLNALSSSASTRGGSALEVSARQRHGARRLRARDSKSPFHRRRRR
jgi:hypothetical protein